MKTETGVMVMKGDKAWGVEWADGQSTSYGWIDPELAPIHNPEFCKSPTDVTYTGSPHIKELMTGTLVRVARITKVYVIGATVPH